MTNVLFLFPGQPKYVMKRGGTSRISGITFANVTHKTRLPAINKPIIDCGLMAIVPMGLVFAEGHVYVKKPTANFVGKVTKKLGGGGGSSKASSKEERLRQQLAPTYLKRSNSAG